MDAMNHFMERGVEEVEAEEVVGKGWLLVDVRTPGEYTSEHIEGSVLRPLGEMDEEEVSLLATGAARCVVVCGTGKRARMGAERLKNAGLDGVAVMTGGLAGWRAAGLPVVRGRRMISIERQVRIAAGALVVTGVLLGIFVSPWLLGVSAFVGAGLVFAGVTDSCAMGLLLARMPWNSRP